MSRATKKRPYALLQAALGLLLMIAPPVSSCTARNSEGPTGGETHFLTRCDETAACGDNLGCLCGVCTVSCLGESDCSRFPGAACVTASPSSDGQSCTSAPASDHCDVACGSDADCGAVSGSHRCQGGYCRAGSGSSGSSVGGAGGAGSDSTGAGGAGACPHGAVPGNQVLVIGDSFMAATHQITAEVEQRARDAGALPAGERYRDVSTLASNTLALNGKGLLDQYQGAAEDAAVEVVIMDAGGTDMLFGRCDQVSADCPVIADAVAALEELFARMATDGVSDVVYVFYPDADDADLHARMDTLRPLAEQACVSAPLACHFVDLRPVFAGHPDYLASDGLDPSTSGASATAGAVWSTMEQSCIAQ